MSILINNMASEDYDLSKYYPIVEKAVAATLKSNCEGMDSTRDYEVSVTFVSNEEIQEMNRKYRNIDRITDVLSFPVDKTIFESTGVLGDIIISFDQALYQAKQYGNTGKREIAFLVIHGVLHLLGYDHCDTASESIMLKKQKEIIKLIEGL